MNKTIKDWITPKAVVRKSPGGGMGLFAKETIKAGEKVVVWKSEYTNRAGAERAKQDGKLIMQWDYELFSIEDRGDDQGYFTNHSCDSNLWLNGADTLIAKRDIYPNEEITADYALWEADEDFVSSWNCNCGPSVCRKKITGKDWRLPEVQKRYLNHFSPLINKRIQALQG